MCINQSHKISQRYVCKNFNTDMKSIGFIFALLYLQASASFFDDFRGAISKVERGFGKLLSDVVTDVKDTIHCTISAVGNVLIQNGILDQKSAYKYNCKDVAKKISPPVIRDRRSSLDSFNRYRPARHFDLPSRRISLDLERSIANVDKTIKEILGYREVNRNLKAVSEKLKNETVRLAEISDMLKRELEKLSSSIRNTIKNLGLGGKQSSMESVLGEIQTLHDIQKHSRNSTEISEIRRVLDKVVDKLNINSNDHKVPGGYDMNEIRNKLQKISSHNSTRTEYKQTDNSSTRFRVHDLTNKTKAVGSSKTFKDVAHNIIHREKNTHHNLPKTSTSLFSLDPDALDGFTPFSSHNSKKDVDDAKKLIEDSKHTDKVLNDFFNNHRGGPDVFSNPDLFNFGKS